MSGDLRERLAAARRAQRALGAAPAAARTQALETLAHLLGERAGAILEANRRDLDEASREGLQGPLRDRLALSPAKLETLVSGLQSLAAAPDPIGRERRRTELDQGLVLSQVQSPIGVILVIFESRPDAVVQIGGLTLRSGNAVVLKGGREATYSNRALVACLEEALVATGLSPDTIVGVEGREAVSALLGMDDLIDLVVPRGGNALVRSIQAATRIPVLGHAAGICHLYLDARADPGMAIRLAVDGKCDYPAACNATETLLVHRAFLPHLGEVGRALAEREVELRADEAARTVLPGARPATEADYATEHSALTLSVRVVDDIGAAIEHIARYGSAHTDAIVTSDTAAAERFLAEVDSASVFVNASTRFADGYRYGLGAEVGISTARIHARGPVGVEGLLTTRWLLRGSGQAVADYGPGKRAFTHQKLPLGGSQ